MGQINSNDSDLENAKTLELNLLAHATGGRAEEDVYQNLRRRFMTNPTTKALLPEFVRTCRNTSMFWSYIKNEADTYEERRRIISMAFNPLIGHFEQTNQNPADLHVSESLGSLDEQSVTSVWSKALDRRTTDPEGAITAARTLLETVIKLILEDLSINYSEKDDLPKLYVKVSKSLNIAPSQHSEDAFRSILGSATNLVNGIGTLRNRLSDAHGHGRRLPVRPSVRHAELTVNLAGAVAMFLVKTHNERNS